MRDDDPSDLVHDEFARHVRRDRPRPLDPRHARDDRRHHAGTRSTRSTASGTRPHAMVVSAAGDVDHDEVVRLVTEAFRSAGALGRSVRPRAAAHAAAAWTWRPPPASGSSRRPTEQANLVLGVPGVARADDRRYTLSILSTALGGGMSSRLFQEIREKRGLAYSVYSFAPATPTSACSASTPAACPTKVDQVLEISPSPSSTRSPTTASPPRSSSAARARCAARLVLGLEDTGSRMSAHRQGRAARRRPAEHRRAAGRASTPSPSTTSARSAATSCSTVAADPRRSSARSTPTATSTPSADLHRLGAASRPVTSVTIRWACSVRGDGWGPRSSRRSYDAPDLELVASLDVGDDLQALVAAGAQVAVDFTHPGRRSWATSSSCIGARDPPRSSAPPASTPRSSTRCAPGWRPRPARAC